MTDLHLTLHATVGDDGRYVVRDDTGKVVFTCPPGQSYIVSTEPLAAVVRDGDHLRREVEQAVEYLDAALANPASNWEHKAIAVANTLRQALLQNPTAGRPDPRDVPELRGVMSILQEMAEHVAAQKPEEG